MNSKMRIMIGILVIGIVLASGCIFSNRRSEEPEETSTVSGMVDGSQLSVKTDKEVYGVGEEITITITNNLSRPIRYIDVCSLRPCHYLEDGWFCEMTDCHGAMMVIEPGSSKEIHDRTRSLVETRLRYEFEYQIVPEDTLYTAHSNEFTIRNNVNAVPTSASKPSPSSVKTETVVSHPNPTEWTNADDGLLSLRLSSDKGEYVSGRDWSNQFVRRTINLKEVR